MVMLHTGVQEGEPSNVFLLWGETPGDYHANFITLETSYEGRGSLDVPPFAQGRREEKKKVREKKRTRKEKENCVEESVHCKVRRLCASFVSKVVGVWLTVFTSTALLGMVELDNSPHQLFSLDCFPSLTFLRFSRLWHKYIRRSHYNVICFKTVIGKVCVCVGLWWLLRYSNEPIHAKGISFNFVF